MKLGNLRKMFGIENNEVIQMETKSRYEVLADLEAQKRNLIMQKAGLDDGITTREKGIKLIKRQLEDNEEELELFKKNIKSEEEKFDLLIASVEESLKRFTMQPKKS